MVWPAGQEDARKQSVIICFSLAQTMSLLPGLEVAAGSTLPTEASSEKGSPEEEVVTSMPQDSGPGAHQALNSTDLDVPTEAVTCESQGTGVWGGNKQGLPSEIQPRYVVGSTGAAALSFSTLEEARLQAIQLEAAGQEAPFAYKKEN